MRGTDANEMLADPRRGLAVRGTLAGAGRIAVFHFAMHQQLAEHMPGLDGRVRVVPDGIRLPASQVDYRAQLGLPPGAFVFVSLAGLRDIKRPLFPIVYLAPLALEFPQLRFKVCT